METAKETCGSKWLQGVCILWVSRSHGNETSINLLAKFFMNYSGCACAIVFQKQAVTESFPSETPSQIF